MKVWLDDRRPAPRGWQWCHSVAEAKEHLRHRKVEWASLDHDLGEQTLHGGTALGLISWLTYKGLWPSRGMRVHLSNPAATRRMLAAIDCAQIYPPGRADWRGEPPDGGWPPLPNV